MTTKLNALISQSAATVTPEHNFRWNDQSGQGHGAHAVTPRYGSFTITGFTQTGNTTNTSTIVTNLDSSVRPRPGMTVTGTGIPASTTVVSVDRSASTMVISNAATATNTGVTLTFSGDAYDPVISFGYNNGNGGIPIVQGEGQAFLQFEGHYHRESDDKALMEAFVAFDIDGSTAQARPIFCWYDKVAKKPLSVDLAPGRDEKINFYFANYNGDTGGLACFEFEENIFKINAAPHQTAEDVRFTVGSHTGRSSLFILSANGDDPATAPTAQFTTSSAGGSSQHRHLQLAMRDDTAQKTGKVSFRADSDIANADSILVTIGRSDFGNTSLVEINHQNMPTNYPTLKLVPKASQTRALVEVDGLASDGTTANARKAQLYPKGYWAYRETGNTTTDRAPSTGASTVTLPTTNCPGTGTSSSWFPMLDANGALFWVPGVSNA